MQVQTSGIGKTPYHRGVVFSDSLWDQVESLRDKPLLAIGGPRGNRVTKSLLDNKVAHPEHHEWPMGEGSFGYFQKLGPRCPQVALYGNTAARTRRAVEVHIDKADGLKAFLEMCWKIE
jgi:hypothetical protein